MKVASAITAFTLFLSASAITVSYDTGYDDPNRSMTAVSCSDGPNGLITRYNFQTQSQIPRFPHIGGAASIPGWNSPNCGKSYRLSYAARSVAVLAIDHADAGFNVARAALDELTGGNAVRFGRVEADAVEVPVSECGL